MVAAAATTDESNWDSITLIQVALELLLLLIYDNSLHVRTRAGLLVDHTVQFVEQDSSSMDNNSNAQQRVHR